MADFQGIQLARVIALQLTPEFIDMIGYPDDSPGDKPGDTYHPSKIGEVGIMTLEDAEVAQATGQVMILVDHRPEDIDEAIQPPPPVEIERITDLDEWDSHPVPDIRSGQSSKGNTYTLEESPVEPMQHILRQDVLAYDVEVSCVAQHTLRASGTDVPSALVARATGYAVTGSNVSVFWVRNNIWGGQRVNGVWTEAFNQTFNDGLPALIALTVFGDQALCHLNNRLIHQWTLTDAELLPPQPELGLFGMVERSTTGIDYPVEWMSNWAYRLGVTIGMPAPGTETWEKVDAGRADLVLNLSVDPATPEVEARVEGGTWQKSGQAGQSTQTVRIPNLLADGSTSHKIEARVLHASYFSAPDLNETYLSTDHREEVSLTTQEDWLKTDHGRGQLTVTVETSPFAAETQARLNDGAWRSQDGGSSVFRQWVYPNLLARGGEEYTFENQPTQDEYTGGISETMTAEDFRTEASIMGIDWDWSDDLKGTASLTLSCNVSIQTIDYQVQFEAEDWRAPDRVSGTLLSWDYTELATGTEFTANFRVDPAQLDYKGSSGPHSDTSPIYERADIVNDPRWDTIVPGGPTEWYIEDQVYHVRGPAPVPRQAILHQELIGEQIEVHCWVLDILNTTTQVDHMLAVRILDDDNYCAVHAHPGGIRAGTMVGGSWNTEISLDLPAFPFNLALRSYLDHIELVLNDVPQGTFATPGAVQSADRVGIVARQNASGGLPKGLMDRWDGRYMAEVLPPSPGAEVWEDQGEGRAKCTVVCTMAETFPLLGRMNGQVVPSVEGSGTTQTFVFENLLAWEGTETYTFTAEAANPNDLAWSQPVVYTAPAYPAYNVTRIDDGWTYIPPQDFEWVGPTASYTDAVEMETMQHNSWYELEFELEHIQHASRLQDGTFWPLRFRLCWADEERVYAPGKYRRKYFSGDGRDTLWMANSNGTVNDGPTTVKDLIFRETTAPEIGDFDDSWEFKTNFESHECRVDDENQIHYFYYDNPEGNDYFRQVGGVNDFRGPFPIEMVMGTRETLPSESRAVLTQDPVNPDNQVLMYDVQHATEEDGERFKARQQDRWYYSPVLNDVTMHHHKIRMFIPQEWENMYDYVGDTWWRSLILTECWMSEHSSEEFHTRITMRLHFDIEGGHQNRRMMWISAHHENHVTGHTVWRYEAPDFAMPVGEWFTMEFFFKTGNQETGRYKVEVQADSAPEPTTVLDIYDWTYHDESPDPVPLKRLGLMKLYLSQYTVDWMRPHGGAKLYFDSLYISNFWNEEDVGLTMPPHVHLEMLETSGNTASNSGKLVGFDAQRDSYGGPLEADYGWDTVEWRRSYPNNALRMMAYERSVCWFMRSDTPWPIWGMKKATVSFWTERLGGISTYQCVFTCQNGDVATRNRTFQFYGQNNQLLVITINNVEYITTGDHWRIGSDYHWFISVDFDAAQNGLKLYRNGALYHEWDLVGTAFDAAVAGNPETLIGCETNSSRATYRNPMTSQLAALRFWGGVAGTAAEALEDYRNALPGVGSLVKHSGETEGPDHDDEL